MTGHFNIFDILRKIPTDLLQGYCARHGVLKDFDWAPQRYQDADKVGAAMQASGESFKSIVAEFRLVWALHGSEFTRAILVEARFHGDKDAVSAVKAQRSNLLKAFWVFTERKQYLENSKLLSDVDKLPPSSWFKRRAVPLRPGPIDHSVVEQLEEELSRFFMNTELRGQNCKIDRLLRDDEELFFVYSEDHPVSDLVFDNAGNLKSQISDRVFLLIFKHNNTEQTLDLYLQGPKVRKQELIKIFVKTVLGEELSEATDDDEVYDLKPTLNSGFEFQGLAELGIRDVSITKMRFVVEGDPWRRFMAEADVVSDPAALSAFVEALTANLPKGRLRLDQICINVSFYQRPGDHRAPARIVYITHPNLIRLKDDELGSRIRKMLLRSGIEPSRSGAADEKLAS